MMELSTHEETEANFRYLKTQKKIIIGLSINIGLLTITTVVLGLTLATEMDDPSLIHVFREDLTSATTVPTTIATAPPPPTTTTTSWIDKFLLLRKSI